MQLSMRVAMIGAGFLVLLPRLAAAANLGRACQTDAECGVGLICLKVTSTDLDGEGPGKGYCTSDCSADATVCAQYDSTGVCLQYDNGKAYCMEGCTFGPTSLDQFDPKKCHGRMEVACTPLYDDQGKFTVPACLPRCNADSDCGAPLKCNPQSGLCTATPPTGKSLGETCTQSSDGGADDCRGTCTGIVHQSGGTPFTYMCTEGCTTGALPSCGWDGPATGAAQAYCLFSATTVIENGGPGMGDLGSCSQLCDCNSDCKNPAMRCDPWTGANASQLVSFFGKKGFCTDPLLEDGGLNPGLCGVPDSGAGGAASGGGGSGGGGGSSLGGAGPDGGPSGGTSSGGGGVSPDAGTLSGGGSGGGCGCRAGGAHRPSSALALFGALAVLAFRRRRAHR